MDTPVYVVVGRSGLILTATTDYEHARTVSIAYEGKEIQEWKNGQLLFRYKGKAAENDVD